jgi:heme/copper-type cytochrome/quinol oxidase subunit 2
MRKVISISVTVWLLCTATLGYWYVVIGSTWPVVSEEYEQRQDYRLAFFLMTWLPILLLVLGGILLVAWRRRAGARTAPGGRQEGM